MPPKKKLTPRELMKQAIEVMRKSVTEPRPNDDAPPAVGVVLVKPNGGIETAFRGEIRQGDHAEYTLLERKNRENVLDGSILYTTLEPCAPGARNPPKVDCAERIVNARIKEVWVGVADPHPKVDRKGMQFLEDNGVAVRMFDRDLQEIIKAENKEFFEQAERLAADHKAKPPKLSPLEDPLPVADIDDFSPESVRKYIERAKISDAFDSVAFRRRLIQQGLLEQQGQKFVPTGFGLLVFGRSPREAMQQAGLLATINYPDGTVETHNFDGPLVMIPDELETWLKAKLPNIIDRSHMQRQETTDLPLEMIREAVVNALVHRDYDIAGAKCQIIISGETIVVKSPGRPVKPITLAQLQEFRAPMLSRNPVLHYAFSRMGLAEERGLGLTSLKARAVELNLPLPLYSWENPYLVLTMFRHPESATRALDDAVARELNEPERYGWSFMALRGSATQAEYARFVGVTPRTAQRHLKRFVDLGLVRRVGRGPATEYKVIGPRSR